MKGKIFFDKNFSFKDGKIGTKLFLVLNTPTHGQPYLLIKATSDKKGRFSKSKQGCNPDFGVFSIFESQKEFFKENTYLQIDDIYEFNTIEFLQGSFNKTLEEKGSLGEHIFNAIINCIKRIKDDISIKHYNMLFK